jgi:hypothetical protein
MVRYENALGEREMSRSEKVLEAKSAFGQKADRDRTAPEGQEKHHFGMIRMVIAGMLFFVLVMSFHFQVSSHGFNRESVKKLLADESHWELLVGKVQQVMNTMEDKNEETGVK